MFEVDKVLAGKYIRYSLFDYDLFLEAAWLELLEQEEGPYVCRIFVQPEYRGQGLCKKLLKEVEADYEGSVLTLKVWPFRTPSSPPGPGPDDLIRMYTNLGFLLESENQKVALMRKTCLYS